MAERHYLPSREDLDVHHRQLTLTHDYFVRYWTETGLRCFYTDGTLEQAVEEALKDFHTAEIFNCNWTPDSWDSTPYSYDVQPTVTEFYRSWKTSAPNDGYNAEAIGRKRNGAWIAKYFAHDGRHYYRDHKTGSWVLSNLVMYANYDAESNDFHVGTFEHKRPQKSAPVEVISKVLKGMNAKQWRGFYADEVSYVCEIAGIRKDQI